MSRVLASALLVLCTAHAQTFARGSSHDASAQNIYDPSEPNAALKARVESLMGLYLVRSPRRHRSERIEYRSKSVKATVWHPVGETSATELMTRAVKWLIFGPNTPRALAGSLAHFKTSTKSHWFSMMLFARSDGVAGEKEYVSELNDIWP
jgi:hypothetical protein